MAKGESNFLGTGKKGSEKINKYKIAVGRSDTWKKTDRQTDSEGEGEGEGRGQDKLLYVRTYVPVATIAC